MRLNIPRVRFFAGIFLSIPLLWACNPTFNWRDVRPDGMRLAFLMPCKPVTANKTVQMAGQTAELVLLSCDAGGVTFAVAAANVTDASKAQAAMNQWRVATLANMKAASTAPGASLKLAGALNNTQVAKAVGQRSSGQAVTSHAAYFAQGSQVYQAVLYGDAITLDVVDTFFSSLKFE